MIPCIIVLLVIVSSIFYALGKGKEKSCFDDAYSRHVYETALRAIKYAKNQNSNAVTIDHYMPKEVEDRLSEQGVKTETSMFLTILSWK